MQASSYQPTPARKYPSMKILPILLVLFTFAGLAAADTTVVVTPVNMDGWAFYSTDDTGVINSGSASGGMVFGPATPPLGAGSANLMTGPGAGDGSEQLRNSDRSGTRIDALTSLSYSTYATSWNGQQLPYLTLWIDYTGDGLRDDRLHFEADFTAGTAAQNIWQTWNTLTGQWYDDNG